MQLQLNAQLLNLDLLQLFLACLLLAPLGLLLKLNLQLVDSLLQRLHIGLDEVRFLFIWLGLLLFEHDQLRVLIQRLQLLYQYFNFH